MNDNIKINFSLKNSYQEYSRQRLTRKRKQYKNWQRGDWCQQNGAGSKATFVSPLQSTTSKTIKSQGHFSHK